LSNATSQTTLSTKSKQIEPVQFVSIWSKGRNFTEKNSFDIVAKTATLLPKTATMSMQHSTLSKGRCFTINSFDIVAVLGGNKVECCFDIVAGVDGA